MSNVLKNRLQACPRKRARPPWYSSLLLSNIPGLISTRDTLTGRDATKAMTQSNRRHMHGCSTQSGLQTRTSHHRYYHGHIHRPEEKRNPLRNVKELHRLVFSNSNCGMISMRMRCRPAAKAVRRKPRVLDDGACRLLSAGCCHIGCDKSQRRGLSEAPNTLQLQCNQGDEGDQVWQGNISTPGTNPPAGRHGSGAARAATSELGQSEAKRDPRSFHFTAWEAEKP